MSEIQTIDQRIRADARKKLKKEIQESANEFMRAINIIGTTDKVTIKTKNNDAVEVYNRDVINTFVEYAVEKIAPEREEKAVREFLEKVESLQAQIDDIYGNIGEF